MTSLVNKIDMNSIAIRKAPEDQPLSVAIAKSLPWVRARLSGLAMAVVLSAAALMAGEATTLAEGYAGYNVANDGDWAGVNCFGCIVGGAGTSVIGVPLSGTVGYVASANFIIGGQQASGAGVNWVDKLVIFGIMPGPPSALDPVAVIAFMRSTAAHSAVPTSVTQKTQQIFDGLDMIPAAQLHFTFPQGILPIQDGPNTLIIGARTWVPYLNSAIVPESTNMSQPFGYGYYSTGLGRPLNQAPSSRFGGVPAINVEVISTPLLLSVALRSESVELTWPALVGQTFTLKSSTNLASWQNVAANLVATNNTMRYVTAPTETARFWRVLR
jgi:hypothetical protein